MSTTTIFIKPLTGKQFPLEIDANTTVSNVKSILQNKEGVPADQQRLIFNGKELLDNADLSSYNILNNSTLHFHLRLNGGLKLLVMNLLAKQVELEVEKTDLILQVKTLLQDKEGIEPKAMKLMFQGKQLGDQFTVEESGLQEESKLQLQMKMPGTY